MTAQLLWLPAQVQDNLPDRDGRDPRAPNLSRNALLQQGESVFLKDMNSVNDHRPMHVQAALT